MAISLAIFAVILALAVEFVTPSVTSPGFPPVIAETGAATIMAGSPHIKYAELRQHGFMLVTCTPEMAQSDWYYVPQILTPSAAYHHGRSYRTQAGANRLQSVEQPLS